MHATGTEFADLDDDLCLVTLPDAARFLSVSRGSLYDLRTTGQLASVHIGRSRRVPIGELRRYIRGAWNASVSTVPRRLLSRSPLPRGRWSSKCGGRCGA
jgi:hypothetical protein